MQVATVGKKMGRPKVEPKPKPVNYSGEVKWCLDKFWITKDQVLKIDLECELTEEGIVAAQPSSFDFLITKPSTFGVSEIVFGIFPCENCTDLLEQIISWEDYDKIQVSLSSRSSQTGEKKFLGLVHWVHSFNLLSLRHDFKTYRFGPTIREMKTQDE